VVFRPNPPKLFMLNLNAWLIFELCDGSTVDQLEHRYCQHVASQMSARDARDHLMTGLESLEALGLIQNE
jgi:hypothetical protein